MKMQIALKSTRIFLKNRSKYASLPTDEQQTNQSILDASIADSFSGENRIKPSPDMIEEATDETSLAAAELMKSMKKNVFQKQTT